MPGLLLLERWLIASCSDIHKKRLQSLLAAVGGLLQGQRLTLTDLGRHLPGQQMARHGIKRLDRLLGNRQLHRERRGIYQVMAKKLLSASSQAVVLVDWSLVQPNRESQVLKAALVYQGRSLTVYEEVHRLSSYNSQRTHNRFLKRLSQIIPDHCRVIVVTDAGFRGPWFRSVEALGWDWVGRVRNCVHYSVDGEHWEPTSSLYGQAGPRLKSVGRGWLSKKHPYECTLYLIRKYRRSRGHPKRRRGELWAEASRCRQMYKQPWLLATSLPVGRGVGHQVVNLYAKRMQVELTFRDDKGVRWGWQLEYSESRTLERLNVLLLIGTLATFISWLVGIAGEARDGLRQVQASSSSKRRTLSTVFVGRYWILRPPSWLTLQALREAERKLINNIADRLNFVGIP